MKKNIHGVAVEFFDRLAVNQVARNELNRKSKVIQFEIEGDKPFYLHIDSGKLTVSPGSSNRRDLVLRCDQRTIFDILVGKVRPLDAYFQREGYKLVVLGGEGIFGWVIRLLRIGAGELDFVPWIMEEIERSS